MSASGKAIFLSYASQDADAVRRICDALQALGLEVWFDQSELRGGEAWDAAIRKQIKACALFVPIISANTQAREEGYFRREWNLAVNRTLDMADDKAFLLPVVIDSTSDANARVPEKFREVQWFRLRAGANAAAFAERLNQLLSAGTPPASPATPRRAVAVVGARRDEGPSIAVLPFVNMSRDEENEYFADGLAEELLNVLAKIRGLRVAARSSAFTFKGKEATVAEVGCALNVATVLEGSVRKSGTRVRIAVKLVNVADGYHLWSQTYDRTLEDILVVQDDIAHSVVKELRTTLLGAVSETKANQEATAQVAAAVKGRTTNAEAHRLYLQARHFDERRTREDVAKGIGYMKQALALDPEFALAWAALGVAYTRQAVYGWVPAAEGWGQAREAVARALAAEPDLAEGLAAMGWIQMVHDWNWHSAQASYRRALELAPGNAGVLRRAGVLAGSLGRLDEAISLYRRALEQDPLSAITYISLGWDLTAIGQLAEAESELRKALDLAPLTGGAHAYLSLTMLSQGRAEEALGEALREPEEAFRLWALAIIHHAAGRRAESDAALQELIAKHQAGVAYEVAEVYAARGEADVAFDWLERAYAQRDPALMGMKTEPFLHPLLHADPRWDVFLRKMGLAD